MVIQKVTGPIQRTEAPVHGVLVPSFLPSVMRTALVLCALLSAASGLTLRPCGKPTSRRALLAGSLCAAVLPAFAEDAPEPPATRMYQNGLGVPELASEPTAAPDAAAPTLTEPNEITRAARSRTEPQTEP